MSIIRFVTEESVCRSLCLSVCLSISLQPQPFPHTFPTQSLFLFITVFNSPELLRRACALEISADENPIIRSRCWTWEFPSSLGRTAVPSVCRSSLGPPSVLPLPPRAPLAPCPPLMEDTVPGMAVWSLGEVLVLAGTWHWGRVLGWGVGRCSSAGSWLLALWFNEIQKMTF